MRHYVFRIVLAAALALGATVVFDHAAHAQTLDTNATCTFYVSGGNDDPSSYQLLEPSPQTLEMAGLISCSGTWRGKELDPAFGTMSISDGEYGPVGTALGGGTCTWGDDNLVLKVSLPRKGRDLALSGSLRFNRVLYWSSIDGDLDGVPFVGYSGLGATPGEDEGTCTNPDDPFHEATITGRFVLADARDGVAQQVAVVGLQYLPSGTFGAPTQAPTTVFHQPVTRGDRITWTNLDVLPHSVTSCAAPCDAPYPDYPDPSGKFAGGLAQFGDVFTLDTARLTPGTYHYYCEFHKYMRGSFSVQPPSG